MVEIGRSQISKVNTLINDKNSHYPLLKTILAGKKNGKVYVNDENKIKAALVLSDDGCLFVIGEAVNSFSDQIIDIVIKHIEKTKKQIEWSGITKEMLRCLEKSDKIKCFSYERYRFDFNKQIFLEVNLKKNKNQIESLDAYNTKLLFAKYADPKVFWRNEEQFIKNGFGKIIKDKSKIIGYIISASVEDNEVEIDIEVDEEYRKKGLAKELCKDFIEECLVKGFLPKWDCYIGNIPSVKIAESFGFEIKGKYLHVDIVNKCE